MSLTPKNWHSFQHYKERKPIWIKLHHALLDDYQFACLPVASRALAPCLWLLASEYEGGEITASMEEVSFRLHMTLDEMCKALGPLVEANFFSLSNNVAIRKQDASGLLAEPEHVASLETETETETQVTSKRQRQKDTGKTILPDGWLPSPVHFELSEKLGLPRQQVEDAAAEMRGWSVGNGERRANWDFVFNNWLRRNAQRRNKNGHGRPGALQDDRSISRAAARLAEAAERGDFKFGPRPGLRPTPDGNVIRLLSQGGGDKP